MTVEKFLNFHTVPFHPQHCCHLCRRRQLNSRKIEITGISLNVQNKRCIEWQIGNLLKIENKNVKWLDFTEYFASENEFVLFLTHLVFFFAKKGLFFVFWVYLCALLVKSFILIIFWSKEGSLKYGVLPRAISHSTCLIIWRMKYLVRCLFWLNMSFSCVLFSTGWCVNYTMWKFKNFSASQDFAWNQICGI